jgi:hypothetical protein
MIIFAWKDLVHTLLSRRYESPTIELYGIAMNKMINTLSANLVGHKGYVKLSAKNPVRSGASFISKLMRSMYSAQDTLSYRTVMPSQAKLVSRNRSFSYLEALRKELLAHGKPLNGVSLRHSDLFVVEDFLLHCGFSEEEAKAILDGMSEGSPRGDITLSRFFDRVTEFTSPEKGIIEFSTLEASAIPHLESALRDMGMDPGEIGSIFEAARVEGGGLDLRVFTVQLKAMSRSTLLQRSGGVEGGGYIAGLGSRDQSKSGLSLSPQISKKLEKIGIQIPQGNNRISIQDLISALEEINGGMDKGNQLPPAVKAAIEKIVDRAVINEEKGKAMSSVLSFSKPGLSKQFSKATASENGVVFSRKTMNSVSKESGGKYETALDQKAGPAPASRKVVLFSDVDSGKRLAEWSKEDHSMIKPETKAVHITQDARSAPYSDADAIITKHQEPLKGFLPTYVIDQVGRGISRSLLRAERVIRLQLRPPELGALKVEMDMKDNLLKLAVITENNSAKELLLSNVHELREALVEQGVKLERLDVQIHCDIHHSPADSHEGNKGSHQGMREIVEAKISEQDEQDDLLAGPWGMDDGGHALDLMA